ncbi:MAG: hypothetical protein RMN25_01375 [Anaerolineae bacterium]|nr:hypothetical protein [Thermoflexales bacterium]MDW8406406.1 hypothetical protein [Anaerolineae bacterium]
MSEYVVSHRTVDPLLRADQLHEDFCIGYCTVLRDGALWRMWYEAYDRAYRDDADGFLCYAESRDGEHWYKPALGLIEYAGSRANNILLDGRNVGGVHGSNVFIDADALAAERFKMVCVSWREATPRCPQPGWWVFGAVSPDGIHWQRRQEPLLCANSDTQTVCFRDGDRYRLYVRLWSEGLFQGKRLIGYTESSIFGDFPPPRPILAPDELDPPHLHFYNSAAAKAGEGLYLMFPSAFYVGEDVLLPHLAVSADGCSFRRVERKPFLMLGNGFDSRGIYVAPGLIPTGRPNRWWVYYLGTPIGHDQNRPQQASYVGGVGRFMLTVR